MKKELEQKHGGRFMVGIEFVEGLSLLGINILNIVKILKSRLEMVTSVNPFTQNMFSFYNVENH